MCIAAVPGLVDPRRVESHVTGELLSCSGPLMDLRYPASRQPESIDGDPGTTD